MKKAVIFSVLLIVILGGCTQKNGVSNANSYNRTASYGTANTTVAESAPSAEKLTTTTTSNRQGGGGGGGNLQQVSQQVSLEQVQNSQPTVTERKIVRNAELQLEADSPEQSQQKITAIAEGKGGFVVESQQSSSDVRTSTRDVVTMTVRVPAEKFNEALDEIRKTANRVVIETVKSDDVTEEFIDTEAQLKAKKALEAQFLEIMKRANTVEDALDVQRQLAEVRGEIEKLEGRKRFLENQASLSTIKIRIQTPAAISANSEGFGYRLKESFGNGFDAALSFILGLVTFAIAILPFLIFIVLPIYLVIRYFLKRRKKQIIAMEFAREELNKE